MTVKDFIDTINNSEDPFYSLDEVNYFVNEKEVTTIDIDKYRDYSFATDIYKCKDGFVGVTGLFQVFGGCSVPSDFKFKCIASEYEEIQVTSYQPKKCHS